MIYTNNISYRHSHERACRFSAWVANKLYHPVRMLHIVIPANAGIQCVSKVCYAAFLDPRVRGNDGTGRLYVGVRPRHKIDTYERGNQERDQEFSVRCWISAFAEMTERPIGSEFWSFANKRVSL